jgi:hypothetical protein
MGKAIYLLPKKVTITEGFPASYEVPEGSSGGSLKVYYVDGKRDRGEIHFSVPDQQKNGFEQYHVTRDLGGKNAQIWYRNGTIDLIWNEDGSAKDKENIVIKLPSFEEGQFKTWIATNREKCDKAAAEFWTIMNA